MTSNGFSVGARVRRSRYALRGAWDWYLGLGREPAKTRAREAHDRQAAERGTVTAVLDGGGLAVEWDRGARSRCLDYMVTLAEAYPLDAYPVDQGEPADTLPTGEQQPRLPGDVGAVRDLEVPHRAELLPAQTFTLTGPEETQPTPGRLF